MCWGNTTLLKMFLLLTFTYSKAGSRLMEQAMREESWSGLGRKTIKVIKWAMLGMLFYLAFLGLVTIEDVSTCPVDFL